MATVCPLIYAYLQVIDACTKGIEKAQNTISVKLLTSGRDHYESPLPLTLVVDLGITLGEASDRWVPKWISGYFTKLKREITLGNFF